MNIIVTSTKTNTGYTCNCFAVYSKPSLFREHILNLLNILNFVMTYLKKMVYIAYRRLFKKLEPVV